MNVVIIGTGNVATVLGKLFLKTGFSIVQVYGRNKDSANELAAILECNACFEWSAINRDADLYLIAIADTALYRLHESITLSNQLVFHTAGSVSKDVLKNISTRYGVLYPLQSLRKEMEVLTEIPLLVEGNNAATTNALRNIAVQLSTRVSVTDEAARLKLHVAAIFINNFTNHLYALTAAYCNEESLDFRLLLPLAAETAKRIEWVSPARVVTGPAKRKDDVTIEKHLALLAPYPDMQQVYRLMTASIREFDYG